MWFANFDFNLSCPVIKVGLYTHKEAWRGNGRRDTNLNPVPGPPQGPLAHQRPILICPAELRGTKTGGNPNQGLRGMNALSGPLPGLSSRASAPVSRYETHNKESLGVAL